MKITMAHVRQVRGFTAKPGFCANGVRRWMESHGLDFKLLLKDGIDEEVLLATGDPMAIAVVRQANGLK